MSRGRRRGRRRAPSIPALVIHRLRRGEHVELLATVGLIVLLGTMAIGPVKSYAAAADRVGQLEQGQAELQAQVDRLEERRQDLHDPLEIEQLARERFGLVRPGEVPYIVVSAGPELSELQPVSGSRPHAPWYTRLAEVVQGLLG
jgi:cell division protein FtsB